VALTAVLVRVNAFDEECGDLQLSQPLLLDGIGLGVGIERGKSGVRDAERQVRVDRKF